MALSIWAFESQGVKNLVLQQDGGGPTLSKTYQGDLHYVLDWKTTQRIHTKEEYMENIKMTVAGTFRYMWSQQTTITQ